MIDPASRAKYPGLTTRGRLIYYRWKHKGGHRYERMPALDDRNFDAAYQSAVAGKVAEQQDRPVRYPGLAAMQIRQWNAAQAAKGRDDRQIPSWLLALSREARKRAKARKIAYSLSRDDLSLLWRRCAGACEVTGIPFRFEPHEGSLYRPFAPSLDRINPGEGYELFNVRVTSVIVNTALNQWGEGPFWEMVLAASEIVRGQTQFSAGASRTK